MARKKLVVETAEGWCDSPPDLTTGEHDLLTALFEFSWHDVQLDTEAFPPHRRAEALAAKLSAYAWITSDDLNFPSFRCVCLLLGIQDVDRARRVVLRGVTPPTDPMPEPWEAEFASTNRQDRTYVKHKCKCPTVPERNPSYTLEALIAEITPRS